MKRWIRPGQLWELTRSMALEIAREPGVLFWGILFPILMSAGLGLAFSKKSETIRKVAVVSSGKILANDSTALGRFLQTGAEKNISEEKEEYRWKYTITDDKLGNSIFLFYEMDWEKAMVQLKRGTINLLIKSSNENVEYHFDPLNPDAELTFLKLGSIIGHGASVPLRSNAEIKPLTITGTRYIDFLIPGLVTMGVMMSCLWGISYGLIEKRSKKLLRRLVATPMKKSHFLIALISVRVLMNFIEATVIVIFALIVFKMKIQGDIPAMLAMFLAGNIAFAGIAVLVSSHTSNTEVGNGLINFIIFPMMILSGIFFSYHNFPEWSIPVIRSLPLTMLTDGIRSIFNEGAGFREVFIPILVLSATGVVFFTAGLKVFKWH